MSTQRFSSSRLVVGLALLTTAVACNSDHATDPAAPKDSLITTLLVSAPSTINAQGQLQLSVVSSDQDTYTYISASPGTAVGATASITNRTRSRQSASVKSVEATITDGGFDPVRVAASAGDTLQIEFLSAERTELLVNAVVVPRVRPPTIVRTNPRPGKKDVPLNARFEIVFSEPIDPASITTQNIHVLTGGTPVAGSLIQSGAFTVEFIPSAPLQPTTSFQIVISTGVRNLGGIGLENESSIEFETAAASDPSTGECSADNACIAFTRNGTVYTAPINEAGTVAGSAGGSGAATMLSLGFAAAEPVWSPDGRRLAVVNWSRSELCVVGADGLGSKCKQVFTDHKPSWSPDGSELAFVGGLVADNAHQPQARQLLALNTSDMSLRVILQDVGTFCGTSVSWSPDGSRIAFTSLPSMCGGLATVRPDGSDLRVVKGLDPAESIRAIDWSPDGQRFAVLTFDEIGTLNVDGTGWQRLVTASSLQSAEIMDSPTWSPDGNAILFGAGWNCFMGCTDNRIMVVKRDGSATGTVLSNAGEPTVRALQPVSVAGSLTIGGVMSPQHMGIRVMRDGVAVTDAIVSVNGVAIPHFSAELYSLNLPTAVPAGETLDLKVISGGVTYEGTGEVIPTPVITAPVAGETLSGTDAVMLRWSTSRDPDRFEVCENCWDNSLDAVMHTAEGGVREFKITPSSLVDYGGGAIVSVSAYKNNFLKSVGAKDFKFDVLGFARSIDAHITFK